MVPMTKLLGISLETAGPDQVTGSMPWALERTTAGGVLHGGALMSFADTLGAISAFLNLPEGATTSTIESKTNFFRAVREGHVHGTSRPVHVGRSTIAVQTEVRDGNEKLVSLTFQTQAVLT